MQDEYRSIKDDYRSMKDDDRSMKDGNHSESDIIWVDESLNTQLFKYSRINVISTP